MAVSQHLQNANGGSATINPVTPTQAPEATAPSTGGKAPKKAGSSSQKSEAFKGKGAALRASLSEDQKALEGSKSDTVAFVCALGDPNRKQNRVEGSTSIPSYLVVGFKFKCLEDTTVPVAPLKPDYKNLCDVGEVSERAVKAGEIVSLNLVETARFMARTEYAGQFTGEGTTVKLNVKMSEDREEPLPILQRQGGGSVKENMELIAEMVDSGDGKKGRPVIKEEYKDMFSVLYKKSSISKGNKTGSAKKKGEAQADIAAAFRVFYGM